MFGAILQCSECKFEFATGWNHHGPAINLLCQDCGCKLHARGKGKEFAARDGEACVLEQWNQKKRKWVKTGCRPTVAGANLLDVYGVIYEFAGCVCPDCGGANVTAAIKIGGSCPRCKKGV